MFSFDDAPNRKETGCRKWDGINSDLKSNNVLAMWIADMDIKTPKPIIDSLVNSTNDVIYGYYNCVIDWLNRKHNFAVEKDWIVTIPGVVPALRYSVQIISKPGDEIIIPTPVYPPFYKAVSDFDRVIVKSSMILENGIYTFDFDDIESKITAKTKAIMLCSPHNPTGRVWTKDELLHICEICKKHNIYIIDDEIHNDLVFNNNHTVLGNISEDAFNRSIICTAPSKTFNIAGIPVSNIIIKNSDLRNKFKDIVAKAHISVCCGIVEPMVYAAYNNCDQWLAELLQYLKSNIEYFVSYIEKEIPTIKAYIPDSTYLLWVDFRGTEKTHDELIDILTNECHLIFNSGKEYGDEGEGFFRINVACPFSYVEEALNRLKKAFSK
ncbi:MAG: MalY/PatB family protein [Oscillospiraceae bacterium]